MRSRGFLAQRARWGIAASMVAVMLGAAAVVAPAGAVASAATDSAGHWQDQQPLRDTAGNVSCASSTFCVTVLDDGRADVFDGTRWSRAGDALEGIPVEGLSCASATFCMAVAGDEFTTFDGTSWSTAAEIPGAASLLSLACVSATFCLAGDSAGTVFGYGSQGWDAGTAIPFLDHGIGAISCATSTFCMAINHRRFVFTGAVTAVFDGTSWSESDGPSLGGNRLQDVSCPRAGSCLVLGHHKWATFRDGQWSAAHFIGVPRRGFWMRGVSCTSVAFCVITQVRWPTAYVGRFGAFPKAREQELGRADRSKSKVACVAPSFCMVVSDNGWTDVRA